MINIILREPSLLGLDLRTGLGARYLIARRNIEDAVGVECEGHVDLGLTRAGTLHARNDELSQLVVAHNGGLLALVDDNVDLRLPISDRRVRARFAAGDGGVALDQGRHELALQFNAERQRGDVQQEEVGGGLALQILAAAGAAAGQDVSLHGGADRHGLVGMDGLAQVEPSAEEGVERRLQERDAGGSADEDDGGNVGQLHVGIDQYRLDGVDAALEQQAVELLELLPGERGGVVQVAEQRIDLDLCGLGRGEGALGGLDGAAQPGLGPIGLLDLAGHVGTVLRLNVLEDPVHDGVVKVLAAQMRVAAGRLDLEHAAVHGENGHVEGAAAQIEDDHVALFRLLFFSIGSSIGSSRRSTLGLIAAVQPVRQSRGRRLVDDALHVEAGNPAGILGGLALLVVEVGRHRDDGTVDLAPQMLLGRHPQLRQDHGGNLLGAQVLGLSAPLDADGGLAVPSLDDGEGMGLGLGKDGGILERPPDDPLHVVHGVARIGRHLRLGGGADHLARRGEGHPAGHGPARRGGDHLGLLGLVVPHGQARVRGAEVDSDDGSGHGGDASTVYESTSLCDTRLDTCNSTLLRTSSTVPSTKK